jgi:hypothetical protein
MAVRGGKLFHPAHEPISSTHRAAPLRKEVQMTANHISLAKTFARRRTASVLVLVVAAVAGSAAGCSKPPEAPAATSGTSTPAEEPVPAVERPPMELEQVGQFAKSLFDAAYANDWSSADEAMQSLNEAASDLPSVLPKPDLVAQLHSRLQDLGDAVKRHRQAETMDDANATTRLAADLSAEFEPKVPYEVLMLGYYGRQLELGITTSRPELLTHAVVDIRSTWDRIEPTVERRSDAAEVRRFTDIVVDLEAARRPSDFVAPTRAELAETDHIEKLFQSTDVPPELVPD